MTESSADPEAVLFFGVLSLIALVIGWKRGFFTFPPAAWLVPLRWFHVVGVFAIYFATAMFLSPILGSLIRRGFFAGNSTPELLGYISWVNFLNSVLITAFITLFLFALAAPIRQRIWRREGETSHLKEDMSFALLAWLLSFPLVLFASQLFDWLVSFLFGVREIPDQIAVQFLKMTFVSPVYLTLSVLTIVLFAPLIEETLFRGVLQTFIRQHLGSKQAIGITSFLFALFHYSPEQGLANLPIIGSLLVLAFFLGFVYEKRGSLFAPIALHATFNLVSVLNLYFLGGFPKSPI